MNKEITFQECCSFIYAAKQYCLFYDKNLTEELLADFKNDHVLIIESDKEQYLVVHAENEIIEYHFANDTFVEENSMSPSFKDSLVDTKAACYAVGIKNLNYFLNANPGTLSTIHEEIDFELALRLRNSFFTSPEVVYVIFVWTNGSTLLCQKDDQKDNFFFGDAQELIRDQKALEKIREDLGNIPCSLKVLKSEPDEDYIEISPDVQQNSFDAGMMVVEMDIPRSKPNLDAIGNDQVIGEDSIVTLDEPLPPLTSSDMAILSKYGIDTIKKKDLHKGIFEGSVVIRDEELPQLGPDDIEVLKKYGIEIPTGGQIQEEEEEEFLSSKQFVFEESQIPLDEELPSLGHEELEIFEKYGVAINQEEKTTPRAIREAFEDSVVVKDQELPALSADDFNILNKYGITLAPVSKEKQTQKISRTQTSKRVQKPQISKDQSPQKAPTSPSQKKRFPIEQYLTKQNIIIVLSSIIALLVIYWGMVLYKNYDERQTTITECNNVIVQLDSYTEEMKKKTSEVTVIVQEVTKKFPSKLGFPEPSPRITTEIKRIDQEIVGIKDTITEANRLIAENKEKEALTFLQNKFKGYSQEEYKNEITKTIDNLKLKANHTLSMAQYMNNIRIQESSVRRVLRKLRENIILFSQLHKSLDSKLSILQEKYPESNGYPSAPQRSSQLAVSTKKDLDKWGSALQKIEKLLFTGSLTAALKQSNTYKNLSSPDGTEIKNMIESVDQTLVICETEATKKERRRQYLVLLQGSTKSLTTIKSELDILSADLVTLQSFDQALDIPKENQETLAIKNKAEQETSRLKQAIENSRSAAHQGDFEKAIAILDEVSEETNLLISLKQVRQSTADTVKIAQSMKQKSEKGLRVVILLQKIKKQLLPLTDLTSLLQEKVNYVRTNFDPDRESRQFYRASKPLVEKSNRMVARLNSISNNINKKIEQENLDDAIYILENSLSLASDSEKYITKIKRYLQEAERVIKRAQLIKYEKQQTEKLSAYITKIKDYLGQMQENIDPLKRQIEMMESRYPVSEGYSEVPKLVKSKLASSISLVASLNNAIKDGQKLKNNKEWDKANNLLRRYAKESKLTPEFLAEISKYRYEIQDMVTEAMKIGNNKNKVFQIKDILQVLRDRRGAFKGMIQKMSETINTWDKKYPDDFFFKPPKGALSILPESDIEFKELDDVIADGEEGLQTGEYDNSLRSLTSYMRDVISVLPATKVAWENLKKTQKKNEKLLNDDSFKTQIVAQRQQEAVLQKIKQEWRKSPGSWYSNVQSEIKTIKSMESNIRRARIKAPILDSLNGNLNLIKNIPIEMAELGVIVYKIKSEKGRSAEDILQEKYNSANAPLAKRKIQLTLNFLRTKTIDVDVDSHSTRLRKSVVTMRNKINSFQPLENKDVSNAANAMRLILKIFKDSFQEIESELTRLR
ncbi:hypothetical protein [Candidatus Uabimicrobium sp. HlEnr_7]|uniref:hypothetical protein n=1 Tax=Candidatus Uabimicrobium helgolandensis TaxID=3095367 RepID=UPI003557C9FC